MKEIQIFNSPQFGEIRVIGTSEEPLFRASDICSALGYSNPRKAIADHVDEGDVTKRDTPTFNQYGVEVIQQATFINESGLYALIFGSKLESAKAFKRWVTLEVLPSIRKTGIYVNGDVLDDETAAKIRSALTYAQETMARQCEEIRLLNELARERKRALDLQQIIIDGRKQGGSNDVGKTFTSTRIGLEVGMTAHELHMALKEAGVLAQISPYWVLSDKYTGRGLSVPVVRSSSNRTGHVRELWTEIGREFIINLINNLK